MVPVSSRSPLGERCWRHRGVVPPRPPRRVADRDIAVMNALFPVRCVVALPSRLGLGSQLGARSAPPSAPIGRTLLLA